MNLGQVYTKRCVADFMVGLLTLPDRARVLDPCFGHGVFIKSLLENTPHNVDGVEIDPQSFSQFENPASERCTLRNCDFFDIEAEYDGIVMNPPYVRQEEISGLEPLGVSKRKLQSSCGMMTISSKANLYMYFILRAILLLRDGGELIAIFPNSWTNTPIGKQFQVQMLLYGTITDFINVEGNPFEGSPLVDVCIMKFVKGCKGEAVKRLMTIDQDDNISIETLSEQKAGKAKGLVRLKSIASIRRGITTGANKIFVNPPLFSQEHLVDILSSPKDIPHWTTKGCHTDRLLAIQPLDMLSEEESTYLYNSANSISKSGKPLTLKNMIDSGFPWYHIPIPEPAHIIFSYIVRRNLRFVLNEEKHNVRDNFYMISSSFPPLLLFSLLNNYHVYTQLEQCGKSYGKGLLKLQRYDIDDLEVPHPRNISQEQAAQLSEMAKMLIETHDENYIDYITDILAPYYGSADAKETFIRLKTKRVSFYE